MPRGRELPFAHDLLHVSFSAPHAVTSFPVCSIHGLYTFIKQQGAHSVDGSRGVPSIVHALVSTSMLLAEKRKGVPTNELPVPSCTTLELASSTMLPEYDELGNVIAIETEATAQNNTLKIKYLFFIFLNFSI